MVVTSTVGVKLKVKNKDFLENSGGNETTGSTEKQCTVENCHVIYFYCGYFKMDLYRCGVFVHVIRKLELYIPYFLECSLGLELNPGQLLHPN